MASISENWNVGISVDSQPAQLTSVRPPLSFLSLLENHITPTLAASKSQFTTAVISRYEVLSQYYQLKNNKIYTMMWARNGLDSGVIHPETKLFSICGHEN